MDCSIDINEIVKELKTHHFTSEYNNIKDDDNERSKILKELIEMLNIINITKESAKNEIGNKVYNAAFSKPWKKLLNFHRDIKLKEFIDEKFSNKTEDEQIELRNLLNTKANPILQLEKNIIYDISSMKIVNIPILEYNEDNKKYVVFVKKPKSKKNIKEEL